MCILISSKIYCLCLAPTVPIELVVENREIEGNINRNPYTIQYIQIQTLKKSKLVL